MAEVSAMPGALLALGLILVALVPVARGAGEPKAAPPMLPGCRKAGSVKFLSHGDPARGLSKVVCTVDYWVCGKAYTRQSEPIENKRGACDGFTASVKNDVGAAACCDQ
jgi:hypothetical protein